MQLRAIDDLMHTAIAEGGPQAGASSVALSPKSNQRFDSVWENTTEAYNLLADVAGTPGVPGRLHASERSASRTPR